MTHVCLINTKSWWKVRSLVSGWQKHLFLLGRWVRPLGSPAQMGSKQALEAAKAFARSQRDKPNDQERPDRIVARGRTAFSSST
jgi:hypothetical protein